MSKKRKKNSPPQPSVKHYLLLCPECKDRPLILSKERTIVEESTLHFQKGAHVYPTVVSKMAIVEYVVKCSGNCDYSHEYESWKDVLDDLDLLVEYCISDEDVLQLKAKETPSPSTDLEILMKSEAPHATSK